VQRSDFHLNNDTIRQTQTDAYRYGDLQPELTAASAGFG